MVTTLVAEWMVMAIAAIAAVMASIARALAARVLLMMPVMKRMASSTLTARMSTAATGQRNAAAVIQMSARVSGLCGLCGLCAFAKLLLDSGVDL